MDEYKCEILIIGAGPAGLSAGVYCGRANRDTIILNGKIPSALARIKEIQNWLGEPDLKGNILLEKFRRHAESFESVKIIDGDVISLMVGMGTNIISTRTANITSDVVIITIGRGNRKEIISGENILLGFGISYNVLSDGPLYKEKVVFIYGSDEEVLEYALILDQMGCQVRVITELGIKELPEKVYEVNDAGIKIIEIMKIIEAVPNSEGTIQKIICKTTKPKSEDIEATKEFELSCLFILSYITSNSLFKKAGVELDDMGNIKVNDNQKTNLKEFMLLEIVQEVYFK